MKYPLSFGITLALFGCATQPTASPETLAVAKQPLICEGKEQCDLYWQRAQFYVNSHSRFKIQLANDSVIQTYSPTGGVTDLGYNISKEPLQGGNARLWVKAWCDNMFGCFPDTWSEIAKVKRYVRTGE
jgi:uncharacterized protein YaiE (UPF0345 family)